MEDWQKPSVGIEDGANGETIFLNCRNNEAAKRLQQAILVSVKDDNFTECWRHDSKNGPVDNYRWDRETQEWVFDY